MSYFLMSQVTGTMSDLARVSNHPMHPIMNGQVMPSAFIPFCSYATNVAKSYHSSGFPACNSFKPVVIEGEQCFQMVLDKNEETKSGKDGGIIILLDTNNDRSVNPMLQNLIKRHSTDNETRTHVHKNPENQIQTQIKLFAKMILKGKDSGSQIYIQTLQGFTSFEAGNYVIRNVKKMTVTSNFLGMKSNVTNCHTEQIEECRMRSFIETVTADCKCAPLALAAVMSGKVRLFRYSLVKLQLSC